MIRDMTVEDIPEVRSMIISSARDRMWFEESGVKFDPPSIDVILRYHIRDKNGQAYVSEMQGEIVGFFTGGLMPCLMDIRGMAAHEKMSAGKDTGDMWDRFIEWALERDAFTAVRGCYDQFSGSRFRRIR